MPVFARSVAADPDGACGPYVALDHSVDHFESPLEAPGGHCVLCHYWQAMAGASVAGRTVVSPPEDILNDAGRVTGGPCPALRSHADPASRSSLAVLAHSSSAPCGVRSYFTFDRGCHGTRTCPFCLWSCSHGRAFPGGWRPPRPQSLPRPLSRLRLFSPRHQKCSAFGTSSSVCGRSSNPSGGLYDDRLVQLEQRLAQIGGGPLVLSQEPAVPAQSGPPQAVPPPQAATEPPPQTPQPTPARASNVFNPDISVNGNFIAAAGKNPFATLSPMQLSEVEAAFQAVVDTYARADFFLAAGPEGLEVEEGYITFTSLPASLQLKVGQDAGAVRQDEHASHALTANGRSITRHRQSRGWRRRSVGRRVLDVASSSRIPISSSS